MEQDLANSLVCDIGPISLGSNGPRSVDPGVQGIFVDHPAVG